MHEFYVSVCEIDYNEENKSLEIAIKLFTDDLELAIQEQGAIDFKIDDTKKADVYIAKYLKSGFQVKVDEVDLDYEFIGKEVSLDNVTWCYVEVKEVTGVSSIEIKNALLTELFDDQKNMVHVRVNDKTKSLILRKSELEGTLNFAE